MNQQRWQALMKTMGLPICENTYHELIAAYKEKHRHYHNTSHIDACLHHLDTAMPIANKPHDIEMALWFHDAVYKPYSSDNEIQSAKWAKRFLTSAGIDQVQSDRIQRLIIATCHNTPPTADNDTQLLLDIDLSILGTEEATYQQFESNIRKEYSKVPKTIFRKKRRAILLSFLERDRIYQHDYFHDRLEQNAQTNIANTLKKL